LLVDDISESGGTLAAAATLLKARGAKTIRAAVTHGMLSPKGFERLASSPIDELITTNSVSLQAPAHLPITCLSIGSLLGEAIKRIHHNESVTGLFVIKGY
jgi:ribose-phosphate pyrophosphokinase